MTNSSTSPAFPRHEQTDLFVTRHPGAQDWATECGFRGRFVDHLDPSRVRAGTIVCGTLPADVAADLCARGARYYHLVLGLTAQDRGRTLTAAEMRERGARLVRIEARVVGGSDHE